jgi:Protein of unknown function (DUF4244)
MIRRVQECWRLIREMPGALRRAVPPASRPGAVLRLLANAAHGGRVAICLVLHWAGGASLRRRVRAKACEAGMATAEYAVGTVAAAAFAVVLYKIVTGGAVTGLVTSIVKRALTSLS